jgi:hypothetical protein
MIAALAMLPMAALAADTPAATPAPTLAPAVATTPAPQAGGQLQELDEIVVRGKKLLNAIADAEDDFYKLYNQLNKDQKYATSCVYLNTDPEGPKSQIKSRVCIPGFVADALADYAVWKARCQPPIEGRDEFDCLDRNDDNRISWQEASAREELASDFTTLDTDGDGYLTRNEFAEQTMGAPVVYQPPPPQLVLMEGSKAWYDHMMSVIRSNPQLQDKAGHLDDLYRELAQVQNKYSDAMGDQAAKKVAAKPVLGPRVH